MGEPQDPAWDLRVATFLDVRDGREVMELFELWGADIFMRVIATVWCRREFVEWRAVVLRLRDGQPPHDEGA